MSKSIRREVNVQYLQMIFRYPVQIQTRFRWYSDETLA